MLGGHRALHFPIRERQPFSSDWTVVEELDSAVAKIERQLTEWAATWRPVTEARKVPSGNRWRWRAACSLRSTVGRSPRSLGGIGRARLRCSGSVARGEDQDGSDVDFLVEFEPGSSLFERLLIRIHRASIAHPSRGCGRPEVRFSSPALVNIAGQVGPG